jgi:predicted outer membrane repeat protein
MEASGGAIFFYAPVENSIFDSVFIGNYALYGGGIFFYSPANCNRFGSDFTFNVAESCGGAMFFYSTTNANNFTGSFINNSALGNVDIVNGNGGAMTFKNNSTNSIFTCDFINNTAAKNGGALNYRQGSRNITFNGNFIGNHANNGAGLNFFEGFENVTFNANFTANSAILGGAIASKNGVVENVSFSNNHADMGGAAYFSDGGTVVNCSFTNNSAANHGGAVYLGGNGTIDKSTFKSNNASDGGAILSYGDLTVKNSIFEGNFAVFKTDNVGLKGNAAISLSNNTPEDLGPLCGGYLTVLNVSNITYGEIVRIDVRVVDENHVPFDKGMVSVVIGGKTYSANVKNGSATIEIPNLNAGNYDVNVTYGERNLDSSAKFKVSRQNAVIIAVNKAYVINYGGKYSVTIKDANGKVISGKKVSFKFNAKNIASAITNAKGIATVSLTAKIMKATKTGKKNLLIQFNDLNYNSALKTVKITVNKERTKLIAKNKKFKRVKKVKKYTVALKNSKGKALKKVRITLKVKGKTYNAKTNGKGKATFKIKKLTKKGKYKATVTYKGNNYYNKVIKKVKITIR